MAANEDDDRSYRRALGGFATGVAVISTTTPGGPAGIVINSFTSVSLKPRWVLWCLGDESDRYDRFAGAERWAVNFLSAGQEAISSRIAQPGAWPIGDLPLGRLSGLPVVEGAAAQLACATVERRVMGDHLVIVGAVEAFAAADLPGLTYFRGRYGRAEG